MTKHNSLVVGDDHVATRVWCRMSHLVLELRPGETMVVNGATIKFRNRCRVELVSKARFLFGKQIISEHDAETTVGRLYFALQTAYVGPIEGRATALQTVRSMLDSTAWEKTPIDRDAIELVRDRIDQDDHYGALKILRAGLREPDFEPATIP